MADDLVKILTKDLVKNISNVYENLTNFSAESFETSTNIYEILTNICEI